MWPAPPTLHRAGANCRYCGWEGERATTRDTRTVPRPPRARTTGERIVHSVNSLFSTLLRLAIVLAVLAVVAVPFGGTGVGPVDAVADDTYETIDRVGEDIGEAVADSDSDVLTNGSEPTAEKRPTTANASNDAIDRAAVERYVHEYVNEKRTERGREPLEFDRGLRETARYYSGRMAREGFFAHTGPDGEILSDRYEAFGYECRVSTGDGRYATGGENLAYTYYGAPVRTEDGVERYDTERELARGIVDGWMNSPGHRENLLAPYWEHEGIGIYAIEQTGRIRVYTTQHFC